MKLLLTVHTYTSGKHLGAVISDNKKCTAFFSRILSKTHCNYNMTEKEILAVVECFKQFRGIVFGYEINVLSDHENLVYAANLSESKRVMPWQLILEKFGPNIQHIAGVDNIVSDKLSRLASTPSDNNESCTSKYQCCANKLIAIVRIENNEDCFPLNLLILQIEQ